MYYSDDTAGVGFQLAMYRFLDSMKEARRIEEQSIAQTQYDWLLAKHNDLVARYNKLLNMGLHAARVADSRWDQLVERDQRIAELEAQLAATQADEKKYRQLYVQEGFKRLYREKEIKLLREARSQQT
jgi:hypothetical protein